MKGEQMDEGREQNTDRDYEQAGEKIGSTRQYLILKRLIEGVFNNIGISRLMEIAEEILGRPTVITDMGFRIVVESPSVTQNIRYHYTYKENVFLDESCIQLIRTNYMYSRMREREFTSARLTHPELGDFQVASIKVSDADVLMMVVFSGGSSLDETELLLLKKICQVMAVEFQKENAFNRYRLSVPNHIISSLLSGKEMSREDFFEKMSYLDWVKARSFCIMLICDAEGEMLDARLASIVHSLKIYLPISHCLMYDGDIAVYLTPGLYIRLYEEDHDDFEKFLKANGLSAVISPAFTDILKSRQPYLSAKQLQKTAHKFGLTLVSFRQAQLYMIADLLEENYRIADFCHPAVLKLMAFDAENHTELLRTLRCYLDHKADPDAALPVLFIRRSTLFYRIKKIREITGLALTDTEEIMELYFSLKIVALYGNRMSAGENAGGEAGKCCKELK